MTTTILGYAFKNAALLEEALTTPACRMTSPGVADNQRLEFLGDAVLGLLAAERLYGEFPDESEGPLTMRRTHMVSASALCAAANRLGLVALLKFNRGAHAVSPEAKVIADAVEAILGAAYLDGGFDAARVVFDALGLIANGEEDAYGGNPKGALQEYVQTLVPPRHPVYELLKTEGASHKPVFTVRVTVEGVGDAEASGGNRQAAEIRAATRLLKTLKKGEVAK